MERNIYKPLNKEYIEKSLIDIDNNSNRVFNMLLSPDNYKAFHEAMKEDFDKRIIPTGDGICGHPDALPKTNHNKSTRLK